MSKSVGAVGGNAALRELTLRTGGGKQFQGQHGNITFSRYKAAASLCVARPCRSRRAARRTAGERARSRTRSNVSKRCDDVK